MSIKVAVDWCLAQDKIKKGWRARRKTCSLPFMLTYTLKFVAGQRIMPVISNIQGLCSAVFAGERSGGKATLSAIL